MNTPEQNPNSEELEILEKMLVTGELSEWTRLESQDLLPEGTTITTLCDVRRRVEVVFGENIFSTKEILMAIHDARGRVTWRSEREHMADMCLVNQDRVMQILKNSKNTNN